MRSARSMTGNRDNEGEPCRLAAPLRRYTIRDFTVEEIEEENSGGPTELTNQLRLVPPLKRCVRACLCL